LLTYAATEENTAEGLQPWTWYKNYVLQGATAAGLPSGAAMVKSPGLTGSLGWR
jgi:hypothetical protein